MAWTLLLGFVALTLVFVWMLIVRYRIEILRISWGAVSSMPPSASVRPRGSQRRGEVGAPGTPVSLSSSAAPAPVEPVATAAGPASVIAPVSEVLR